MTTMTLDRTAYRPAVAPGELRLTRRGRLVVFAVALLLVFLVGVFVSAGSVATTHAGRPAPTRVVVVGSNDTLWQIASTIAHGSDTRAMVQHIQDLNAMQSGVVYAGQRLIVPAD